METVKLNFHIEFYVTLVSNLNSGLSLEQREYEYIRSRSRSPGLGWSILTSHVVEEVVDVQEEVIVGEVVVEVRGVRDEEVSSRAKRSPKTLSPFSRTVLKEVRFRMPTVPTRGARRKSGWGRVQHHRDWNRWQEEEEVLVCLSERSDLPFIGERPRRELKGTRETKRTGFSWRGVSSRFSVHFQKNVSDSEWHFVYQLCVTKI